MLNKLKSWVRGKIFKMILRKLIKELSNMKGSFKTSLYGLLAALGVMGTQLMAVIDTDPMTNVSIETLVGAVCTALAIFGIGAAARDKNVSTEQERAAKND